MALSLVKPIFRRLRNGWYGSTIFITKTIMRVGGGLSRVGSCPVVGFVTSDIELQVSSIRVFVDCFVIYGIELQVSATRVSVC